MGIETIALVAGAVISAGGAIYAGDQQRKASNRAADQADADAEASRGQAMVEARKIREAGKKARSTAVAALAASGVDVSTGTAEQIQTDISQRSEEDALTTILNGKTRGRFMEAEAGNLRLRGESAQTAGYINAGSSLLSSVAASGRSSGWKSSRLTAADYGQ